MTTTTCAALLSGERTLCSRDATGAILIEGLSCDLCPAHLFEHACEAVGWDVDVDDGRDLATIADELLDASMSRGSDVWARAHGHVMAAVGACQTGDVERAVAEMRSAEELDPDG